MSPFASMASQKSMSRMVTVIAVAGLLLLAAQASSADTVQSARRQMLAQIIGCMKKRMSASRTISYNEAARACKEQVRQGDSSGPLVAADTPAKP